MGKGYGKFLIEMAVGELKKLGFKKILLWVLEENHRARKFYEKCGFVQTGESRNDNIGGKDLKEVMYIYITE